MKKAFTLAELIGVIVLLGALSLIIISLVSSSMKGSKEDLYNNQIDNIKLSLQLWMSENQRPNNGEIITLSLSQLKHSGLVDLDIKNPKTEELFPNDMLLKIKNNDNIIEYEVIDNGNNLDDYTLIPSVSLIGDTLTYVEVNSNYTDLGVVAKDRNGNALSNVTNTTNLNINQIGTYLTTYTVTHNGYTNTIYRTIVVRDTIGPVIEFDDLTLSLSEVATYDFKSDITVTDNSLGTVTVDTTDNINVIAGTYTVEYKATDPSGNTTTKSRLVTLTE